MLFDPSLLVLFCFAITCIMYGAHKSRSFMTESSRSGNNTDNSETVSSLKLRQIIIFVVVGSVFLLLLFYFFNLLQYLLYIFVMIVSAISLFVVGAPIVDFVFDKAGWTDSAVRVPIFRSIRYSLITIVSFCLLVIGLWIGTGNFMITNFLAWCIGVTQMALIRLPNLKLSVVLLGLFLLYDVFWVFISPYIFGESVMVSVATKMPLSSLPLTLSMPHIFEKEAYSLIGLGDIVLPGMFICFTYNFDEALKYVALYGAPSDLSEEARDNAITVGKIGYFTIAMVGYTAGFVITLISFIIMEQGQPALLYLVPGVLLPVCAAAFIQGHLRLMWNGPPANVIPVAPNGDEEQALVSLNEEEEQQLQQQQEEPKLQNTTARFTTITSAAPTSKALAAFTTSNNNDNVVAPNISVTDIAGDAVLTTSTTTTTTTTTTEPKKIDGADVVALVDRE